MRIKIMELNGDNNKIYLENIIAKIPKAKGTYSGHLWRTAQTIPENLEIILKNSEEYNINIYEIMILRSELFSLYVNLHNNKAQQMADWFSKKDKNEEFKLWQMSENQKFYYARYLGVMGTYHKKILKNFEQSIPYCTKALTILDKLDDEANYGLKFNLISYIYDSYVFLGKTQFAEELLAKMAKLVEHGVIQEADMSLIYSSKSVLCEMQGKYHEALEYVDKIIELFIKNGSHIHDLYFTGTYISRAKMLSFLGRYQEAYTQAQQVYNIYKPIKNEDNEIFANIYTEMARSILGLNKVEQAYEYIKKAISIFLASENSNSKQTTNYSNNPDLASSYIVQGDILFTQNRLKQAIESYKKAFVIYHYLYGDRSKNIAQVSTLYKKGAKAACKSKDLYNYKFFGKPQIKEFGIHHPNTVDMFEYCKQYNMDIWVKNN